jgi:hypothetical protein
MTEMSANTRLDIFALFIVVFSPLNPIYDWLAVGAEGQVEGQVVVVAVQRWI